MKKHAYTLLAVVTLLWSCGSDHSKHDSQPTPASEKPAKTAASPDAGINPASLPPPVATNGIAQNPSQQQQQQQGQGIAPVDPNAQVPFDNTYGNGQVQSGYDPSSPNYMDDLSYYQNQINGVNGYNVGAFGQPYLYDQYQDQRAFLNFQNSFGRIQPNQPGWTPQGVQGIRDGFQRSRQWVTQGMFATIARTLAVLNQQGYQSPNGLEGQIRLAMSRGDHQTAARLNDLILREADAARGQLGRNQGPQSRPGPQGPGPNRRF